MPRLTASLVTLLLVVGATGAQARAAATIQGRISNAMTDASLGRAVINVAGSNLETRSDDDGFYQLTGVSPGETTLTVSYIGFAGETASVTVTEGARIVRDFALLREGLQTTTRDDGVIVLPTYAVVAEREMSAQAMAMNEQRDAANTKSVVAYDEYGDRGSEHVGEFLRFIPSITMNDAGLVANEIVIRGFPSEYSQVAMDGGQLTSARGGNTRTVSVLEIPTANISRVEVNKVPTPDMPAEGLGGSLNIITKNGFEYKKPSFRYQTYLRFNTRDAEIFGGGPRGHAAGTSPDYKQPSFEFDYQNPLTKNFAISVGGGRTWRQLPTDAISEVPTWNLVNGYQRTSQWQDLDQVLTTLSGNIGLDWRISPRDTLSFKANYRQGHSYITRNLLLFNYGTGAVTGGETFTQGVAGATANGSVTMNTGSDDDLVNTSNIFTAKYTHRGDRWRLEANASFSKASYKTDNMENGHFGTLGIAALGSLSIRGEGIGEGGSTIPTRYTAVSRTGAPVDIFDGGLYTLNTVGGGDPDYNAYRSNGRLDVTREFAGKVPFALKAGLAVDQLNKQRSLYNPTFNFRPNGLAPLTAGNYDLIDEGEGKEVFGQPTRWISKEKAYQLYLQHPDWFVRDEVATYLQTAQNRLELIETITAGYLRGDVRLFRNRLLIAAGARYERTTDKGFGPLTDPLAQYVKNPDGTVFDSNPVTAGVQPQFLSSDLLVRAQQRVVAKGAKARKSYSDIYPSINTSFELTDKLLLRAAYARTVGRPNSNFITPGSTITEPTVAAPAITINNPDLKPWTADNYDLTLEAYNFKGAFASIGLFHKDVSNFFTSVRRDVTPELLAEYDIPNDPAYANYDLVTRGNSADVTKISGLEVSYRQSLDFVLPEWAKGVQVFINGSRMHISGGSAIEFDGFNPASYSGGINFIRSRYFVKLSATYQAETKRAAVGVSAGNGIPAGTFTYQNERLRITLSAQYSLSKRLSVYATINDLGGGFNPYTLRYAPGTPEYMRPANVQKLGSGITVGINGQF